MSSAYPKDEFDDIQDGGPVGVHRKPSSRWRPVLPFLVVLVVVPLLAWGVASLIQRNVPDEVVEEIIEVSPQSEPQSEGEKEEVVLPESDVPTAAPDSLDEEEAETPAEQQATDTPVNYSASIGVYNASGVQGYAGDVVSNLAAHGFDNAFADNADNWGVDQNTVFYANDSSLSTAQQVAADLGFGAVVQDPSNMGDLEILVLLVN